jgi:hypothetical protein
MYDYGVIAGFGTLTPVEEMVLNRRQEAMAVVLD